MMFWQQYKKELLSQRGESALIVGALVLWYVFLATRVGHWPGELIFTLGVLPVGFLPVWTLWTGLQLYRQEWRENTHYLMLSVPAPVWKITLPKLLFLMTGAVGYSLVLALGIFVLFVRTGIFHEAVTFAQQSGVPLGDLAGTGIKVYGLVLLTFFHMGLITQVAFVVSRLFRRFQGLIMAWVWLLQMWLTGVASEWLGPWLNWLPSITLRGMTWEQGWESGTMMSVAWIFDGGLLWATLIVTVGLYVLLNVALSKAVEVS